MGRAMFLVLALVVLAGLAGFSGWQYRQNEIDYYTQRLNAAEIELQDTKIELKSAIDELAKISVEFRVVKSDLQVAKAAFEAQKKYYEEKLVEELERGKRLGYAEALEREIFLRDPTYQELKDFLDKNDVDSAEWTPGKYVCVDFAADLNNDAEAAGIRAAYVWLIYEYNSEGAKMGHLLNGFNTVDRGLIFIEPQTDREVKIEVGKYHSGSKIKEIIIVW